MILDIKNNLTHRKMYKAAKDAFVSTVPPPRRDRLGAPFHEQSKIFFDNFANSYNARIICTRQYEWLDITALEFDDEKDYIMFVLRWS